MVIPVSSGQNFVRESGLAAGIKIAAASFKPPHDKLLVLLHTCW